MNEYRLTPQEAMRKLEQLAASRNEHVNEMLTSFGFESKTVPGICINDQCHQIESNVHPTLNWGHCTGCQDDSVMSCLLLNEIAIKRHIA